MAALFILALLGLMVWWFWKGRDWAAEHIPAFRPYKEAHDEIFLRYFGASRTKLVAYAVAALGYLSTAWDLATPLFDLLTETGIDLGSLLPGPFAKVGPALIVLGHLFSYMRSITSTSVEENKAVVEKEILVPAPVPFNPSKGE